MKRKYSDFLSAPIASGLPTMDDHDQTKRHPQPTGSIIDAGTTPLWHSSQLHPAESAMRSTLPSPGCNTSIPALPQQALSPFTPPRQVQQGSDPMAIDNLIHPTSTVTSVVSADGIPYHSGFTPINSYKLGRPRKAQMNNATYKFQTGRFPSDMEIDMNQIDSSVVKRRGGKVVRIDESLTVDKDDGRVWHLGNANDSFSGTFINDDPEKIETYAVNLAKQIRERIERPARMALTAELLGRVRTVVNGEGVISVERTSYVDDGEPVICERPSCLHKKGVLPTDTYYVNVAWESFLCLRCFEILWKYNLEEAEPDSDPFRRDSAVASMPAQFDGPADYYRDAPRRSARLKSNHDATAVQHKTTAPPPPLRATNQVFQSRWAVSEVKDQLESPQQTPRRQNTTKSNEDELADEPMNDSASSIDSEGQWIHPPVAVQHIAKRLEAGASLTATDKIVFAIWQAASGAQLRWNHHLLRTKMTRDYYQGTSADDKGPYLKQMEAEGDDEWEQLKEMEVKIDMRMKDCNGRELSFMLNEAAKKKKDIKT